MNDSDDVRWSGFEDTSDRASRPASSNSDYSDSEQDGAFIDPEELSAASRGLLREIFVHADVASPKSPADGFSVDLVAPRSKPTLPWAFCCSRAAASRQARGARRRRRGGLGCAGKPGTPVPVVRRYVTRDARRRQCNFQLCHCYYDGLRMTAHHAIPTRFERA